MVINTNDAIRIFPRARRCFTATALCFFLFACAGPSDEARDCTLIFTLSEFQELVEAGLFQPEDVESFSDNGNGDTTVTININPSTCVTTDDNDTTTTTTVTGNTTGGGLQS